VIFRVFLQKTFFYSSFYSVLLFCFNFSNPYELDILAVGRLKDVEKSIVSFLWAGNIPTLSTKYAHLHDTDWSSVVSLYRSSAIVDRRTRPTIGELVG
jgi:hypothetical protein